MAALPSIVPSYGAQKTSSPSIRSVQYGDGYQQRLKFGLNQNPKVWNLRWNNISESDADTLEEFFNARADDCASFDWEPLDESAGTIYKFVVFNWSKNINAKGRASIQATFRQVFEP